MKTCPRETLELRDYLDPGLTGRTLSDARHSSEPLEKKPKDIE